MPLQGDSTRKHSSRIGPEAALTTGPLCHKFRTKMTLIDQICRCFFTYIDDHRSRNNAVSLHIKSHHNSSHNAQPSSHYVTSNAGKYSQSCKPPKAPLCEQRHMTLCSAVLVTRMLLLLLMLRGFFAK
jgi:hypothetical protein